MHNLSNKDTIENNPASDLIYVGFTIQVFIKKENDFKVFWRTKTYLKYV